MFARIVLSGLVFFVVQGACGKSSDRRAGSGAAEGSGQPQHLPADARAFGELLPDDVIGFAYVDFGGAIGEVFSSVPVLAGVVEDLLALAQRRWKLDLRQAHGVGVYVVPQGPVIAVRAARSDLAPRSSRDQAERGDATKPTYVIKRQPIEDGVDMAPLGELTVIGSSKALVAATRAVLDRRLLSRTSPSLLLEAYAQLSQRALVLVASGDWISFIARTVPPARRGAAGNLQSQLANLSELSHLVVGVGAGGLEMVWRGYPDREAHLRHRVDSLLRVDRSEWFASLETEPTTRAVAVLLRAMDRALAASISVKTSPGKVVVSLPWHAPRVNLGPPSSYSLRAVEPDEWGLVQLDLGAPLLETLLGYLDVLGAPLDRAAIAREVVDQVGAHTGLPRFPPRNVILSLGRDNFIASLHAEAPIVGPPAYTFGDDRLAAIVMPWGLATTYATKYADRPAVLEGARAPTYSGLRLPLATRAGADPYLRAYFELTRAPRAVLSALSGFPARSVLLEARGTELEVVVTAAPGQAAQIARWLVAPIAVDLAAATASYRERADANAAEELDTIWRYHLLTSAARTLTPSIDRDRLVLTADLSPLRRWPIVGVGAILVALRSVAPYVGDLLRTVRTSEVERQLAAIQQRVRQAYLLYGELPVAVGVAPEEICCRAPHEGRCRTDPKDWAHEPWTTLGFRLEGPQRFRFMYQGEKDWFDVTAAGDPACNGEVVEHTVRGKIIDGELKMTHEARP